MAEIFTFGILGANYGPLLIKARRIRWLCDHIHICLCAGTASVRSSQHHAATWHLPPQMAQPDSGLDHQCGPVPSLHHFNGRHHGFHKADCRHQDRYPGRNRSAGDLRRSVHRPHGGNLSGRGGRRCGRGGASHGRLSPSNYLEGLSAVGKALSAAGRFHLHHHDFGIHRHCRRSGCGRSGRPCRSVWLSAPSPVHDAGHCDPDHHSGAGHPVCFQLVVHKDRQASEIKAVAARFPFTDETRPATSRL